MRFSFMAPRCSFPTKTKKKQVNARAPLSGYAFTTLCVPGMISYVFRRRSLKPHLLLRASNKPLVGPVTQNLLALAAPKMNAMNVAVYQWTNPLSMAAIEADTPGCGISWSGHPLGTVHSNVELTNKGTVHGLGLVVGGSRSIQGGGVAVALHRMAVMDAVHFATFLPLVKDRHPSVVRDLRRCGGLTILPATPDALLFLNHSCDPSLAWDATNPGILRTRRRLVEGDELTFDYSTLYYPAYSGDFTGTRSLPSVRCRCLAPNCRGKVYSRWRDSATASKCTGGESAEGVRPHPFVAAGMSLSRRPILDMMDSMEYRLYCRLSLAAECQLCAISGKLRAANEAADGSLHRGRAVDEAHVEVALAEKSGLPMKDGNTPESMHPKASGL